MKNPILRKELMMNRKSSKLSIIILIFNTLLWIYVMFNLLQMEQDIADFTGLKQSAFITLFRHIVMVEFLILFISVPITSALSITEDRERKTLDLVLTTLVTPKEVILGKMMNSMYVTGLALFSTLPILSLTFVLGGMTAVDFWTVFLIFMVSGFVLSGIGIYASCRVKDSLGAIFLTYAIVAILYVIGMWASVLQQQRKPWDVMALLVYNPIYTMLMHTNSVGGGQNFAELTQYVNGFSNHSLWNPFFFLGQILQILTGIVFLLFSVKELKSK